MKLYLLRTQLPEENIPLLENPVTWREYTSPWEPSYLKRIYLSLRTQLPEENIPLLENPQLPEENIPLLENPQLPYLNEILPASVFIFTPYFAASSGLSFKSFLKASMAAWNIFLFFILKLFSDFRNHYFIYHVYCNRLEQIRHHHYYYLMKVNFVLAML